jgi:hypothetical protein
MEMSGFNLNCYVAVLSFRTCTEVSSFLSFFRNSFLSFFLPFFLIPTSFDLLIVGVEGYCCT